ncbi:radical SAM protein [Terriglobus roseus]|uniref:Radical SAM superfamily enzyme, MoaA/NifB/PqqE/SkfB family n=1 Tax=Terriglobus roseus TaxID=392734 RepID=A0A1G7MD10_9BACT|nr:radical SAM protein [Terriglobus roseus]SDF59535.1 Radical SAM superfamily enzyme, MoaA/NifB/PqqE/SkfB family [Terriglobus roseus]
MSTAVATPPALELKPGHRPMPLRRRWKAATRRMRELLGIGHALLSTSHPYMAQIVPMRRCNLACTYCNEYDDHSAPTPLDEMLRRIDHLGRLGTTVITISGGEPLMHPDLDEVIKRIRKTGALAGMITNGYYLNKERIERLNKAGLDHMQISIDNVMPDAVSKKSLKVLDQRLIWLAEYADFHVNINSVVGGGVANPQDAFTVSSRALGLGFSSTIGIIHDGSGQLKPLGGEERTVWERVRKLTRRSYSRFNHFQEAIANGMPNDWRCRAGGRYLYVCENGLVHYCSQQRGYPATPLADYTTEDVKREFLTEKGCAPNCTISCVHQVSYIDHWRAPQTSQITPPTAHSGHGDLVQIS